MADNTTVLGLNYLKLPSGTTAERPSSPTQGYLRYNTSTGYNEYWDSSQSLPPQWMQPTTSSA